MKINLLEEFTKLFEIQLPDSVIEKFNYPTVITKEIRSQPVIYSDVKQTFLFFHKTENYEIPLGRVRFIYNEYQLLDKDSFNFEFTEYGKNLFRKELIKVIVKCIDEKIKTYS